MGVGNCTENSQSMTVRIGQSSNFRSSEKHFFKDCSAHCISCKVTITRCDLSATVLLKLVDSYLIAFKFAQ